MKKLVKLASVLAIILLVGCASKEKGAKETKTSDAKESYKVGIVQYMDHVSLEACKKGFEDEIKKSGLDVDIDYQNANGDAALTVQIPQKFISDKVDLIYAIATPAAQGALNATTETPILFAAVTDPVGAELVKDLKNVGGNVTGITDYIDPKGQIESFLKIYPDTKTFGVIYNTGEQNSRTQLQGLENACKELGLEVKSVGISSVNDLPAALTSLKGSIDALFAMTDNTVASGASLIAKTLREEKIPSLSAEEGQVKNGLLMSEGVDYYEEGAQAAKMAIKILKGEKVQNLPVEEPEKKTKVVNEETAKALGLDLESGELKDAQKVK